MSPPEPKAPSHLLIDPVGNRYFDYPADRTLPLGLTAIEVHGGGVAEVDLAQLEPYEISEECARLVMKERSSPR